MPLCRSRMPSSCASAPRIASTSTSTVRPHMYDAGARAHVGIVRGYGTRPYRARLCTRVARRHGRSTITSTLEDTVETNGRGATKEPMTTISTLSPVERKAVYKAERKVRKRVKKQAERLAAGEAAVAEEEERRRQLTMGAVVLGVGVALWSVPQDVFSDDGAPSRSLRRRHTTANH
jgi:hypothetical protein